MKRHAKQILALTGFAMGCTALGMGLSRTFVAQAQENKPVTVEPKGLAQLPPIAEVAEKLNPTVVFVSNTTFVKAPQRNGRSPYGMDPFEFFFGPNGQGPRGNAQPEEQKVQGFGSGVLISGDGEILTNYHVIEGARGGDTKLEVKLSDGKEYPARVLGKDKDLDLALLKIEGRNFPYAALGDSDATKVGEWVVAIGNPLGLQHTVTQGIISAKGRNMAEVGGRSPLESYLQTDAAINRGNSGGPLLNLRGEVIGINTAINPYGQNIGFAVPINSAKRILADLRAGRAVSRGYLGISMAELDKAFQESLNVHQGVVVGEVVKGQAAEKAGLQRLDVITSVDGRGIKEPEDLQQSVGARRAGEKVRLGIVRDGKPMEITVTLGDRKNLEAQAGGETDEPDAPGKGSLDLKKLYGFEVDAITPVLRQQFGLGEEARGVVITEVAQRSDAGEKLAAGWVITAVGTRAIKNVAEFEAEVQKAKGKALILQVGIPQRGQLLSRTVAVQAR